MLDDGLTWMEMKYDYIKIKHISFREDAEKKISTQIYINIKRGLIIKL